MKGGIQYDMEKKPISGTGGGTASSGQPVAPRKTSPLYQGRQASPPVVREREGGRERREGEREGRERREGGREGGRKRERREEGERGGREREKGGRGGREGGRERREEGEREGREEGGRYVYMCMQYMERQ